MGYAFDFQTQPYEGETMSPISKALNWESNRTYWDEQGQEYYELRLSIGWIITFIFLGALAGAAIVFSLVIFCDRRRKRALESAEAMKNSTNVDITAMNIRKYEGGSGTQSMTTSRSGLDEEEGLGNMSENSENGPDNDRIDNAPAAMVVDETCVAMCRPKCELCENHFKLGDDICQSNNPNCGHEFHPGCMTKWLKHQNKCPLCHENYIVSETVARAME